MKKKKDLANFLRNWGVIGRVLIHLNQASSIEIVILNEKSYSIQIHLELLLPSSFFVVSITVLRQYQLESIVDPRREMASFLLNNNKNANNGNINTSERNNNNNNKMANTNTNTNTTIDTKIVDELQCADVLAFQVTFLYRFLSSLSLSKNVVLVCFCSS